MIDHKNQLIFIHLEKTGGSSIERIFLGKNLWSIKNTFLNCINYDSGREKHVKLEICKNILYKQYFKDYKKICIVRNPYTLFISKMYWFNGNYIKKNNITTITKYHILNLIKSNKERWNINSLFDFLGSKNEYDHIIYFENYKNDYLKMLNKFDLNYNEYPLIHINKCNHRQNYRKLKLSIDAIELIKKYSLEYFNEFGYSLKYNDRFLSPDINKNVFIEENLDTLAIIMNEKKVEWENAKRNYEIVLNKS